MRTLIAELATNDVVVLEGCESRAMAELREGLHRLALRSCREVESAAVAAKPSLWVLVEPEAPSTRIRTIRATGFDGHLYVLASQQNEDETAILEAGADGFAQVPLPSEILAARISALLRRSASSVGARPAAELVQATLSRGRGELVLEGRAFRLSPREISLVTYLNEHAGRWLPRERVLLDVFGAQTAYDSSLVRTHVCNIRRKLGESAWLLKTDRLRGVMLAVALSIAESA